MTKHIAIIQGHPDPDEQHFSHALAKAYAKGAESSGHEVKIIEVAKLSFPLLRNKDEFEQKQPPEDVRKAQETIRWANHLVIIYPLWLGAMPAILKAFFEQALRPGFAFSANDGGGIPKTLLDGRSARIVLTMGMPAFVYRWFFHAHSLKNLKRNILGFCGVGPIKESLIGSIEEKDSANREKWLARMRTLGTQGA